MHKCGSCQKRLVDVDRMVEIKEIKNRYGQLSNPLYFCGECFDDFVSEL